MFIVRSGAFRDIPQLQRLAKTFPLCSLTEEKTRLWEIVEKSTLSFKKSLPIEQRRYLFVLELEGKIIGSSQILSYQGQTYPYFFLNEKNEQESFLELVTTQTGRTQLGGLILEPRYRSHPERLGRQIGLFRFLYIAENPEVFTEKVEVSLTAPLEDNNARSEFWSFLNCPDLPKEYPSALQLYKKDPIQFFSSFYKQKQIPLKTLPEKIKKSLKEVHRDTLPVYKGLLNLGFKKTNRYHILDGGIFLEGERQTLSVLRESRQVILKKKSSKNKNLFLWGKETEEGFIGGLLKGELLKGSFLTHTLPSSLEDSRVRVISLYP